MTILRLVIKNDVYEEKLERRPTFPHSHLKVQAHFAKC
jgi:hypothetical protein